MLPLIILDTHILRRALFDRSGPDDEENRRAAEDRSVLEEVWAKCYPLIYSTKLDSELAGRVIGKHGSPEFETVIRELKKSFNAHGKLHPHTSKKGRQQEFSDYGEDWHLFEAASNIRDRPVWLITREEWMLKLHASKHPGTIIKPPWDFVDEARTLGNCIEEPLPV